MKIVTSYKVKIKGHNKIFEDTLAIYREALAYLIAVVGSVWKDIPHKLSLSGQTMHVEKLVHSTSKRVADYDFDEKFYKLPSYLRRAAISEAIGIASSYRSNLANWHKSGKKGKEPSFQTKHYAFPALFGGNMYVRLDDYTAKIKIFHKNDWVWLTVSLRKSDADYILRHKAESHEMSPALLKKGKNWYLRFAFVDRRALADKIEVITAVDLGINNPATCTAMLQDGTIIGRKIIRFPVEQDQLEHKTNKIKKAQKAGAKKTPRLWSYANNWNRALSEKTANAIIEFAKSYNSDAIVVEHLDFQGKKRGSKKQRLHLWRKKAVIAMVTCKAHLLRMRISTVNPRNTSRLAFDGSGPVERGKYMQDGVESENYGICVFATGKIYHADLNASYNIGARYFIREILKTLPETVRLDIEAKAPRLSKRTTCTLSDLISLDAELKRLAA